MARRPNPIITDKMKERFWSKVDVRGPDECWPWTAGLSEGYGAFAINLADGRWVVYRAHAISLAIAGKDRPGDACACHTCDNRWCVNPDHLWWGTPADNLRDMRAKGRGRKQDGEANPAAKLTAAIVAEIRSSPLRNRDLVKLLGIGSDTISRVRSRKIWKTVP